ncbi:MaoC family dehydratase [Cryobacterium sp. PH31-O1]|uniref:MaoC family dehydratase n=1 Tax=Cryobacterium sp. PH31-O1 TaxID=3046306 RepID=UPI0024BBCD08|nr:MaoC family dehydratase [Cryobacterium sp. PH31-O1]MDJ0337281.1 MaoC family dehydratase [Cryobacterium sp. PH31-O1]
MVEPTLPRVFYGVEAIAAATGEKLGPTPWLLICQDDVDTFARVTQDWQPLHCDPAAAALSPWGTTIAHGYLTMSLLSLFAGQLYRVDGVAHIVNYGIDKLRFPAPVPVGSRIRARAVVGPFTTKGDLGLVGVSYVVEVEGASKPCLIADTLVGLVPDTALEIP